MNTNTTEKKKFKISKDIENILIKDSTGRLLTLKRCFDLFRIRISTGETLTPLSSIMTKNYDLENNSILIAFSYNYTREGENKKIFLSAIIPDNPSHNWSVEQVFLIMEELYILKLNKQIINNN